MNQQFSNEIGESNSTAHSQSEWMTKIADESCPIARRRRAKMVYIVEYSCAGDVVRGVGWGGGVSERPGNLNLLSRKSWEL